MFTILEFNSPSGPGTHSERVAKTACESYIVGCDSGEPFNLITKTDRQDAGITSLASVYRNLIPGTTKIVSGSFAPSSSAMGEITRQNTPFALIQAAGNDPDENGADPGTSLGHWRNAWNDPDIAAALRANKILVVAGYTMVNGKYVRHAGSVSCDGVDNHCLYAPYVFQTEDGRTHSGTSIAVPQVASALASVLAVFPQTSTTDLVKLAKACAVAESGLNGLGRADFTCMTTMDDNGQWKVVGVDEVLTPMRMSGMHFPGQTTVSSSFSNGGESAGEGNTITLSLTRTGSYNRGYQESGILADMPKASGFSPIFAVNEGNHMVLGGIYRKDDLFIATGYEVNRPDFFGLGPQAGYHKTHGMVAEGGHKNLYVRFSQQTADGKGVINRAKGTSVGITAEKKFALSDRHTIGVKAEMDRFLGGTADTAFGSFTMSESDWNHRLQLTNDIKLNDSASFGLKAGLEHLPERGAISTEVSVSLRAEY